MTFLWIVVLVSSVVAIMWGADLFAEHVAGAAAHLGVSKFALVVLLAGAEPEELATAISSAIRNAPAVALGDVIGANVAMCLVALGIGALIKPIPFRRAAWRYGLLALPLGSLSVWVAWDGFITRAEGLLLVASYFGFVGVIWFLEKAPPAVGELGEIEEAGRGRRSETKSHHLCSP